MHPDAANLHSASAHFLCASGAETMRQAAEFAALFTPFTLAGKRLRNPIRACVDEPPGDAGRTASRNV